MTQIKYRIRAIAIIILALSGWKMLLFPIPNGFGSFRTLMIVIIALSIIIVGIVSGILLLKRTKIGLQLALGFILYIFFGEIIFFLMKAPYFVSYLGYPIQLIINYGLSLFIIIGAIIALKVLLSEDSLKIFDIPASKRRSMSFLIGLISFALIVFNLILIYLFI